MTESKAGLFSSLQSKLGMDVTTGLQLPMWLHEPSTHLTRMAEMIHFADLLNEVWFESKINIKGCEVRELSR
jgi:hypothetical protein